MQVLLAAFMLFKCAYWFADLDLLFSQNSIVYKNSLQLEWWKLPVFVLYENDALWLAVLFLLICYVAAFLIIWKQEHARISFFILWLAVSNINNRVFCTLSGGDLLLQHLLFFAMFLSGSKNYEGVWGNINKMLHNTGVLAMRLQLCVLYFMAGYTKLIDQDWIEGNAIEDIFKIYDYNIPLFYDFHNQWLAPVLNYTVLFYQLLFPVMIWVNKIKKWYLAIGMIQHLFIAFAFGLPTFGFIMVISYGIFHCPDIFRTRKHL